MLHTTVTKKPDNNPLVINRHKEGRMKNDINYNEIHDVLNRAAVDIEFFTELIENGTEALADYSLSHEAMAAIVSGDINWIVKNVGGLTDFEMKFLSRRLEAERW